MYSICVLPVASLMSTGRRHFPRHKMTSFSLLLNTQSQSLQGLFYNCKIIGAPNDVKFLTHCFCTPHRAAAGWVPSSCGLQGTAAGSRTTATATATPTASTRSQSAAPRSRATCHGTASPAPPPWPPPSARATPERNR